MRKIWILVLAICFTQCNDDMQFAQHGIIGSYTQGTEIELIWVLGDSHATKRNPTGSAYGPTPTAGTVFQWDTADGDLYEIGATDILQSGAGTNWGSLYPQYGISRNADTGRMIVFVTSGTGGSNYSPRTGDTGDWTDADVLYSTAKGHFDDCLAFLQGAYPNSTIHTKAKVILGVNDARGATALATIQTDIGAFYDRFETDYPGMEVGIVLPGRDESGVSTARLTSIREYLIQEARVRTDVYIACSEAPFWANSYYDSDDLHLLQTGNNELGKMLARWDANSAVTNKWARAVVATHFDDISSARKTLINDFFTAIGDDYFELEYLLMFRTTDSKNIINSWRFTTAGVNTGSAVFTANDNLATNGSSTYYLTGHIATVNNVIATSTDYFDGVKIKTNNSAAGGSTRVAIGVLKSDATSQSVIGQTNSSTVYGRSNDVNTLNNGETKLADDSFYANYRNGTTKGIWKNAASSASVVSAAVSAIGANKSVGCARNDAATPVNSLFISCDFVYAVGGKYTTMDMANLYNSLETLIDNW